MRYNVIWRPSAEQDLATLWLQSTNRNAFTVAANTIDQALRRAPASQGESRSGSLRIMIVPPLAVYFEIHELVSEVIVLAALPWGRSS